LKTRNLPQSGTRGDIVASHNLYGYYLRQRPSAKKRRNKPRTADTDRTEGDWRAISALWNTLSDQQYDAWAIASSYERSRPRLGQSGRLPPRTFFFKVNSARASLGQPFIADPPARATPGPNPVGQLHITNRGDRVLLKLDISGAGHDLIKVYGAAPLNRGTRRGRGFRVLGLLPPPRHGQYDITLLYVQRFGAPPPGKRIFIRTVVEVNGHQSSPCETNCLVPPRPRPVPPNATRRALWADPDV
jgi:hypothetical protein